MYKSTQQRLIPCHYHRFCKGHVDPARPLPGNLCQDCFDNIDEGYEQVEQEELADRLAAEGQDDAQGGRDTAAKYSVGPTERNVRHADD